MDRIDASFDVETHAVQPGLLAPPIVCGSQAIGDAPPALLRKKEVFERARVLLLDERYVLIGANIAYDFGCLAAVDPTFLELIFKAYEQGRVYDILTAQALDAIAGGHLFRYPDGRKLRDRRGRNASRYSLDICVELQLGRQDAKAHDFWRKRYYLLEDIDPQHYPEDARQYPLDDADNTRLVKRSQADFRNLGDLPAQCETAWALHLGAVWGARTHHGRVERLALHVEREHEKLIEKFKKFKFIRECGTENGAAVARATAIAYGATGTCEECSGKGRVRSRKEIDCKGIKHKNRFQGCLGATCTACKGKLVVDKLGNEINCKNCSGTGLDLTTSPNLPRTDKGGVSTSRDTLSESGDEDLAEYGDNESEKIRSTYIPFLREGLDRPINLRPNVLVESGRTSYEGLIQLMPREGLHLCDEQGNLLYTAAGEPVFLGVRDCFMARDGYVYCSVDYSAIELCTLAQICYWILGSSVMMDTINRTKDPGSLHTALAAKMIGEDFDTMKARVKAGDRIAKNTRQAAKPVNFGLPGGMGAARLVLTNRKHSAGKTAGPDGRTYAGIRFCILIGGAESCGLQKVTEWNRREIPPTCLACLQIVEHQMKPAWNEMWPEMREYHAWVKAQLESTDGMMLCFGEDRERRVDRFTAGANSGFQQLAAAGGKAALRAVTREAYLDRSSYLYGTRPIMFIHDEIFSEMPETLAHLAGPRKAELMIAKMREYVPDVHVSAEPALMRFMSKEASPRYENGKLVVWEPKTAFIS